MKRRMLLTFERDGRESGWQSWVESSYGWFWPWAGLDNYCSKDGALRLARIYDLEVVEDAQANKCLIRTDPDWKLAYKEAFEQKDKKISQADLNKAS